MGNGDFPTAIIEGPPGPPGEKGNKQKRKLRKEKFKHSG